MPIKLSHLLQLEQLGIGHILKKFPVDDKPEDNFDWNRKKEINTYEIKGFNHKDGTWKLVQIDDAVELFTCLFYQLVRPIVCKVMVDHVKSYFITKPPEILNYSQPKHNRYSPQFPQHKGHF